MKAPSEIIQPLKMEEKIFDEVIKVNLGGTFLVNQITANAMKEFKINGSIVNISSIAGNTYLLINYLLLTYCIEFFKLELLCENCIFIRGPFYSIFFFG